MTKYFMNNDEVLENFEDIKLLLSSCMVNGTYKMGFFSKLLPVINILVYDLPELTEKFPKSFRTENTLFVHSSFFEIDILLTVQNYTEIKTVISNGLIDFIQEELNFNLNAHNKSAALCYTLSLNEIDESLVHTTSFFPIKELDSFLSKLEVTSNLFDKLGTETRLKSFIEENSSHDFFKYFLKELLEKKLDTEKSNLSPKRKI